MTVLKIYIADDSAFTVGSTVEIPTVVGEQTIVISQSQFQKLLSMLTTQSIECRNCDSQFPENEVISTVRTCPKCWAEL